MRGIAAGILVFGLLVSVAIADPARGVSFDLNYSDPASDVVKLWAANMTPVLTDGELTMSPFPQSVNVLRIRSANVSADVNVSIEVVGDIATLANTSYEMRLFTRADNASHFRVTYVNGATTLRSNRTGFTPVDLSGRTTITSNTLRVTVAKSLLGAITNWNIDAVATQLGTTYSYQDFGWEVPGNPGSTVPPTESPPLLPSWIWLAIAPVVIAIIVAIGLMLYHRKTQTRPKR